MAVQPVVLGSAGKVGEVGGVGNLTGKGIPSFAGAEFMTAAAPAVLLEVVGWPVAVDAGAVWDGTGDTARTAMSSSVAHTSAVFDQTLASEVQSSLFR